MLTVKKLREIIKNLNDNSVVLDEQLCNVVHTFVTENGDLILSTSAPIGKCNRTGSDVYPSAVDGYSAYCPEIDEDLCDFEWTPISND